MVFVGCRDSRWFGSRRVAEFLRFVPSSPVMCREQVRRGDLFKTRPDPGKLLHVPRRAGLHRASCARLLGEYALLLAQLEPLPRRRLWPRMRLEQPILASENDLGIWESDCICR